MNFLAEEHQTVRSQPKPKLKLLPIPATNQAKLLWTDREQRTDTSVVERSVTLPSGTAGGRRSQETLAGDRRERH